MEGMLSVWVDRENYRLYKNGKEAVSWEAPGKNERINLLVPVSHVSEIYDNGREGYEIDICSTVSGSW